MLGAKREGAVYSGPWQESQPVQPKDRSMIEALYKDRADVFSMPAGMVPGDEYFASWIGNGHADRERSS